MKLTVSPGAGPIIFFKSAAKMLAAVVSCMERNICHGQRTVCQQKSSLFQSFSVDIICNRAVHMSGKQGLEIRFVNSGVSSQFRNPYIFCQMRRDIQLGFFQVYGTCCLVIFQKTLRQLQHGAEKQQPDKVIRVRGSEFAGHMYIFGIRNLLL